MTTASETFAAPAELVDLVVLARREKSAGRLAAAAEAYRRILALRPDIAEAHNDLGNVLAADGKLDEAAAEYLRATSLKPGLFESHTSLAQILRAQGKLDQALARYELLVALRPDRAEIHNELGNILREQGKLDQALARFQQALALRPELAELHYNVGCVLQAQGKLDEAAARYEHAIALRPDLAVIHNNLGTVLKEQNQPDQAAARYEQALALKPDFAEAHNNLGNVLKQQGKFDAALASYGRSLALGPGLTEAHYHRADLKTFRTGDADLAALEAIAANPGSLPPAKMVYVHFALGKALEDAGEYARAFEHLLQANALKRREIDFDAAAYQRTFRLVAELFDSTLLDRLADAGDPSATPIFVLGMPRSGSTLVEQILASHPQVHAAGELLNLDRLTKSMQDVTGRPVPFPRWILDLDADSARGMGEAYLTGLPPLSGRAIRITDKAPGNFLYVGLIRLMLPNAKIIHTMRNPVDTCVSCFSRFFPSGQTFSYDLAELGRYYRGYHDLMGHWRSVLPAGAMLDVAYEDVVDHLEEQARRLIDFCGLPWDDRCLSFHRHSRPIATASNVQVRRPLYRDSLARWRRYEAPLQPLLAELESVRREEGHDVPGGASVAPATVLECCRPPEQQAEGHA